MTHDELLQKIDDEISNGLGLMAVATLGEGLKAVVELHSPDKFGHCIGCDDRCGCYEGDITNQNIWITCPTIEAIIKGMES